MGCSSSLVRVSHSPIPEDPDPPDYICTSEVSDQEPLSDFNDQFKFQNFMNSENRNIFEYHFISQIGRGSHGEVYQVENTDTGEILAAKVYDKKFLLRKNLTDIEPPLERVKREVDVMSMIHHPNCIGALDVIEDDLTNTIIIIIPYAEFGSLLPQRAVVDPIPEDEAKRYFYQVASAVQYLHSQNIIHRDIKPENILKFSDGHVSLADFSTAVVIESEDDMFDDIDGTPAYYAPEEWSSDPYKGKPADIWALGVSLYLMLFGKLPFIDTRQSMNYGCYFELGDIVKNRPLVFDPQATVSEEAKNLISMCLEKDPEKRITIDDVLESKWLEDAY